MCRDCLAGVRPPSTLPAPEGVHRSQARDKSHRPWPQAGRAGSQARRVEGSRRRRGGPSRSAPRSSLDTPAGGRAGGRRAQNRQKKAARARPRGPGARSEVDRGGRQERRSRCIRIRALASWPAELCPFLRELLRLAGSALAGCGPGWAAQRRAPTHARRRCGVKSHV